MARIRGNPQRSGDPSQPRQVSPRLIEDASPRVAPHPPRRLRKSESAGVALACTEARFGAGVSGEAMSQRREQNQKLVCRTRWRRRELNMNGRRSRSAGRTATPLRNAWRALFAVSVESRVVPASPVVSRNAATTGAQHGGPEARRERGRSRGSSRLLGERHPEHLRRPHGPPPERSLGSESPPRAPFAESLRPDPGTIPGE
jgi:hypothetical protein